MHVENEIRKTVKTLHNDHGKDYCSKEFEDFCDSHGFQREPTVAYTPQQNGDRRGKIEPSSIW